MAIDRQNYDKLVARASPPSKLGVNMLKAFLIGGAICIILGIVLFVVGRKKDAPLPEKKLDVGEVLNKYLMEEKTETFFD